jgi:hypothetical protein
VDCKLTIPFSRDTAENSLDGLSTPVRKASGTSGVPSRLAANGAIPSPTGSPFGPPGGSYSTPSKNLTPAAATGSSYRPGPSKLVTPAQGDYLSTPVGKSGDRSGASSPVSGPESPSS